MRNRFIDVMKGICILFVLITHYVWADAERLRYFFPYWIDMAVPIFLIITGYVYSQSYEKKEIRSFSMAYQWKHILDKLIRYTIPFFAVWLFEVVVLIKRGSNFNPILLFLHGGVGGGSYYYPILLQLIFLFPVIYFLIKRNGFKGLIICAVINFIYEVLVWAYMIRVDTYRLLVFRYIFVIAFGVYLFYKKNECRTYIYKAFLLVAFVIGATFIYMNCYRGYVPTICAHWTRTSLFAVPFIFVIADIGITKCKWGFKPLELLGKASYNIFLVQMVYHGLYAPLVNARITSRYVELFVTIIIPLILGCVFYFVEQPITKRVLSYVRKKER